MTLDQLEKRLQAIENRNYKVELDKAWETSNTRRLLLIVFTYLSVGFYLSAIKIERPWLNAIVPSLGFLLSTLTLPIIKDIWMKQKHKTTKKQP